MRLFAVLLSFSLVSTAAQAEFISIEHNDRSIRELAEIEVQLEDLGVTDFFSFLERRSSLMAGIEFVSGRVGGTELMDSVQIAAEMREELQTIEELYGILHPNWKRSVLALEGITSAADFERARAQLVETINSLNPIRVIGGEVVMDANISLARRALERKLVELDEAYSVVEADVKQAQVQKQTKVAKTVKAPSPVAQLDQPSSYSMDMSGGRTLR